MAEKSEDKRYFSLFSRVNQTAGKETDPSEAKTEPVAPQSPPSQPAPINNNEEAMRRLEQELFKEKEKALKAEILLKERENVRLEMEQMFQAMKEQLKGEKLSQGLETELAGARGRVEALEKRLDEMNQLFLKALGVREELVRGLEKITNAMAAGTEKHVGLVGRLDEVAKTCARIEGIEERVTDTSGQIIGLEERLGRVIDNINRVETGLNDERQMKNVQEEKLNGEMTRTYSKVEDISAKLNGTSGQIAGLEERLGRVIDNINRVEAGLNDERQAVESMNRNWVQDKTEMAESFSAKIENIRLGTDNIIKALKEKNEADTLSRDAALKENLLRTAEKICGIEGQLSELRSQLPVTLNDEVKNMYTWIRDVYQTVKAELREYVYVMDSQGIVSPKILDRKNELIELMTKINIEIGRLQSEFLKTRTNPPLSI